MASRHRSAWRRRLATQPRRASRDPFAIPVVLGLIIGAVIAFNGGGGSPGPTAQQPLGATQTPSDSGTAAGPAATGSAPIITDAANVNCDIIIPANPLTAQGLATPYLLTGPGGMSPAQSGCEMTNAAALGAFVQATILDPATGQLSVYDPLVITKGTTPAVQPLVPAIPAGAVVTVDFGFNGTDLFQVGATADALKQGNCMNGMPGSIFGQVSFCNGTNFFNAAFQDERAGKLKVPSAGTSTAMVATDGALGTGKACPVTRNFDMVDQDPSDNVTSEYLLNPATGQTAQDTASNAGNLQGSTLLLNGSDNALLDLFIDPVLGCRPFMAPDLANNDMPTTSQALDELLAAANQPQNAALVPENDEMVLDREHHLRRGQDRRVPGGARPGPDRRRDRPRQQPGDVLPEHDRHPDAVPGRQPGAARPGAAAGGRGGRVTCSPSWPTGSTCRSPTWRARTSGSRTRSRSR